MGKLIKNTTYYAIGNILPQLFGFILLPLYTRYLTPTDYGIVTNMQVVTAMVMIIFTLSLDSSIYRLYYDYKTDNGKKEYLGTILISMFFISTVVFLILLLFRNYVSGIFEGLSFFPWYALAIATSYLSVFAIIPKMYYQITEKANKFVYLSIMQFLSTTLLIIWFIIFRKEGAIGMMKGIFFGNLVLLPIFLIISFKTVILKFKFSILKPSLLYALPIVPYILSNWVMGQSNRIFINKYFTAADNGIFALGFKIAAISIMLAGAVALAYNPHYFKLANSTDQQSAKKEIYRNNNIIILGFIFIGFFIALFSKDLIIILMHPKYLEAYKIIPLIIVSNIFIELLSLSNLAFSQEKKTKQLMYIVMIVAAFSILLNFLLIPPFGIYGAAYSAIISQAIYFGISYYFSKRYYFVPFNWKLIIPVFLLLSFLFLISFFYIKVTILTCILKAAFFIIVSLFIYLKYKIFILKIISGKD